MVMRRERARCSGGSPTAAGGGMGNVLELGNRRVAKVVDADGFHGESWIGSVEIAADFWDGEFAPGGRECGMRRRGWDSSGGGEGVAGLEGGDGADHED